MISLSRWIASLTLTPLAVLTLQGVALNAQAFTDTNTEMKERAAAPRVVAVGTVLPAKPVQVAWVPATAKSLDGFKPVLPPEAPRAGDGTRLAKADAASGAKR